MQIILASQSPRRKTLLEQMHVAFDVIPSDYDERLDDTRPPKEVVQELALAKARVVAERFPDAVVIGCDSIVTFNDKQLGKAASEEEARTLLQSYSESSCQVLSAVAVVCHAKDAYDVDLDIAEIQFDKISDGDIDTYVATGDYADKAGSFAVQHPLIRTLIKRIDGRSDTVIGLPTHILAAMLKKHGISAEALRGDESLYDLEF